MVVLVLRGRARALPGGRWLRPPRGLLLLRREPAAGQALGREAVARVVRRLGVRRRRRGVERGRGGGGGAGGEEGREREEGRAREGALGHLVFFRFQRDDGRRERVNGEREGEKT